MKIAIAGLALCMTASAAAAQGTSGEGSAQAGQPGMRGQGRGQMLLQGITLSADQQEKVDAIRAKYRAEREKAMPSGAGGGRPDSAAREKMSAMMDKQNMEIRALLDAEQQKLFDRNLEEMKKRRQQMRSAPSRS